MKEIRSNWIFILWIGSILAITPGAVAWEIDFQPRLEGGVTYYTFESEAVNDSFLPLPVNLNTGWSVTQETFEFSDYLPFISYGGTVFFERFYLDFTGQKSATGKDSAPIAFSAYSLIDADWENNYLITDFTVIGGDNEARFDRNEMAVSLGYAVSKRFNVYAGYKWAGTKFDTTYDYTGADRYYGYNGQLYAHSVSRWWGNTGFSFEYEGPFVGGLYGWQIDSTGIFNGILTASVALAHLSGKVQLDYRQGYITLIETDGQTMDENSKPLDDGGLSLRYDTKGEALGATIGLAWRGVTAIEGLSYYVGVNGYRYEFESEEMGQSDINETALSYRIGLSYLF